MITSNLFSISNYFLRFSNEYKTVHKVTEFDNNWYEYVVQWDAGEDLKLKSSLLKCGKTSVMTESVSIKFEVDLAEYEYDVSCFERDNGMGPDAVHSFDSETSCTCPYCGKVLHITGWIREYQLGTPDSEEIDVDTFEGE